MAIFSQPGVKLDIPTPDEGEVVLLGSPNQSTGQVTGTLGIIKGNTINQLQGVYGYGGETSGVNNYDVLKQLGLDPSKIRSFNPGDLELVGYSLSRVGDYRQGQTGFDRATQLQSNINAFTSLYGGAGFGTGNTAVSGQYDKAAAQAALDPNNAANTAARQAAEQRLGSFQTAAGQQWIDPATGQQTPMGVGIPKPSATTPPPGATYISDPKELSGLTESQIWREKDAQGNIVPGGKIYKLKQATLVNSQGEKKVVNVGSQEANQLLSQGYQLGTTYDYSKVNAGMLTPQDELKVPDPTNPNTYDADVVIGSAQATAKSIFDLLQAKPKSETETQLDDLYKQLGIAGDTLVDIPELQAQEEQARQIEQKNAQLASLNTQMQTKLAEIDALDKSYQAANAEEALRPQVLSRLRGSQAANYRNYIAQRNLLAADLGIVQAQALGLQGEIQAAQEAANRAVDLKFKSAELKYNNLLNQINILTPQLEKEEASWATAVNVYLQQEQQKVADEKARQQAIFNSNLQAMYSNPAAGINLTDTPEQAARKLAAMPSGNVGKFTQIGTDIFGNPQYGFVNEQTGTIFSPGDMVSGNTNGYVATSTGEILDIGSYATDPNHESSVQSILDRMGQMTSYEQMNSYIQSVAPGSPITGEMIGNASQQFGVSWEGIMAIMQQDSNFGTAGKGARTFNPGNVGNTDSGAEVNYGNWQAGVNAVAQNLSRRQVQSAGQATQPVSSVPSDISGNPTFQAWAREYASTGKMPSSVKPQAVGYVSQMAAELPKGEGALIDLNTLVAPNSSTISAGNKDGLLALYDLQKKSEELKSLWNNIAATGFIPGIWSKINPTKDQQKYEELRTQVTDLITRARTGAALNAQEEEFYKSLLPGQFNTSFGLGRSGDIMIDQFTSSLAGTLETKLQGYNADIIGRQAIVDGIIYTRAFQNGQLGWVSNE